MVLGCLDTNWSLTISPCLSARSVETPRQKATSSNRAIAFSHRGA